MANNDVLGTFQKCVTCDTSYIVCAKCKRDESLYLEPDKNNSAKVRLLCRNCRPEKTTSALFDSEEDHIILSSENISRSCKACRVAFACRADGCGALSKIPCKVCTRPMPWWCKAHADISAPKGGPVCDMCYKRHCDTCSKIVDVTCRRCTKCDKAQCRECFDYVDFLAKYTEKGAIVNSFYCNECNHMSPADLLSTEPVFTLMDVDLARCMPDQLACKHLCTFMVFPHRLTIQTIQSLSFIRDIASGGITIGGTDEPKEIGGGGGGNYVAPPPAKVSVVPSAHIMSLLAAESGSELRAHIDAELSDEEESSSFTSCFTTDDLTDEEEERETQ